MPKITEIKTSQPSGDGEERVKVFVDGAFCTTIRSRTFSGLQARDGLSVGTEISCEELKQKESFFWKEQYGKDAWEKEKVRLNKVKALIEGLSPSVEALVVGFGADSAELIASHPDMAGAPDLEVRLRADDVVLLLVEVTGTEIKRGDTYWVRPDKLGYADKHPDKNIWVILHYAQPEQFVFIKPTPGKTYNYTTMTIRGAGERMVVFTDEDPEVRTESEFQAHLQACAGSGSRVVISTLDWFEPNKHTFVEVYTASYLGAFAACNGIKTAEAQPFDAALALAIASWDKYAELVYLKKTPSAPESLGGNRELLEPEPIAPAPGAAMALNDAWLRGEFDDPRWTDKELLAAQPTEWRLVRALLRGSKHESIMSALKVSQAQIDEATKFISHKGW